MKLFTLLQLAPLSAAFVVPEANVFNELEVNGRAPAPETQPDSALSQIQDFLEHLKHELPEKAEHTLRKGCHQAHKSLDDAVAWATDAGHYAADAVDDFQQQHLNDYFDGHGWLNSAVDDDEAPSHGPPHRGPPRHDRPPHHGPPGHGKPPHHGKTNRTVYELIAGSKYTTKLAGLINEYPDLVHALNTTSGKFTVFAPVDSAFEKIPKHAPKPSKEQLEKLLSYHVVPDVYPAGRVLASRTVPTLFQSESLGGQLQRLSINLSLKGLTVNFYSRVIAVNIFASNGVIHGVDSLLIPPPSALTVLDLLPSAFSTLSLALEKTDLHDVLNKTAHAGATFFTPTNGAFARLGPKANAFLFSAFGKPYLAALLKYHVVFDQTLYSDAFYGPADDADDVAEGWRPAHYELPTLLADRSLSIDVARYGRRFVELKINGFNRASIVDGIVKDGVIHIPQGVIVPPRTGSQGELEHWDGESEMTVEELMERLEPVVARDVNMDL